MDLQVARDLFTARFGATVTDEEFVAVCNRDHPLWEMVHTLCENKQFMWCHQDERRDRKMKEEQHVGT